LYRRCRLWLAIRLIATTLLLVLLVGYLTFLRPWQLRWGASDVELALDLPGDDFICDPSFNATRAITINAPPEMIWPWIVQIGHKRAGWYSYDWIDNLGRRSFDYIDPTLQTLEEGDVISASPDGRHGFHVHTVRPCEHLLLGNPGELSWVFFLRPISENQTRLITRVRLKYKWLRPEIVFYLLLDVGDIVMMRRCMLGIKERAEAFASAG